MRLKECYKKEQGEEKRIRGKQEKKFLTGGWKTKTYQGK